MTRVAVMGATGFVGSAVVEALRRRGVEPVGVPAPRLTTSGRSALSLKVSQETVRELRERLDGFDAVVLAAGLAEATSSDGDALFGANSLLPAAVAQALESAASRPRLVHVSSAAVQGRTAVLDETTRTAPFSLYSASKTLGEELIRGSQAAVVYRPASVHGPGRRTTATLVRVAKSRLTSVAGAGETPTPQMLVENVGDAVAFLTLYEGEVPAIVMHPWEGMSCVGLLRSLGDREPLHLPPAAARLVIEVAARAGHVLPRFAGVSRRLEMLWFGQRQARSWLTSIGWVPPAGPDGWSQLRAKG